MGEAFVRKVYFEGVAADKQLKFDPEGVTMPALVAGTVYALDGSGDVVAATATSDLVLGIYTGDNDKGFPVFEQLFYTSTAAFTARGTRWYLDAAGALTATPNDALFGIAVDADTLFITWNGLDTGGIVAGEPNTASSAGGGASLVLTKSVYDLPFRSLTSPNATVSIVVNGNEIEFEAFEGADVQENGVSVEDPVNTYDFISDTADGKPFADVSSPLAGAVDIEIDKQIDYIGLAGSGSGAVTGFDFVAATYRSAELFYHISNGLGEYETGSIYILHDGTSAAVRVDKLDSSAAAIGGTAPSVTFSADVNGGNVRLLYTEADGDDFNLSVKPRVILQSQTVTVEFTLASSNVPADTPSTHNWTAEITTSDGQPLVAQVQVDVQDDLTGSADGSDYTMTTPQTLTWAISAPSGQTQQASLSVLGNDQDDDVDTSLTNAVGCSLGAQTTHQINLQAAVP